MFLDTQEWPHAPGGFDPPPMPTPRISATQERIIMRVIGTLLMIMFLSPFAGSSVVSALIALVQLL
jgi:hypothetical protein